MKLRYLYAWFVLLLVAIVNGGLRDLTYGKHVSELLAHQISCVIGIALFAVVISQHVRRWPPASAREAWFVGVFWMALTVAFEFLFFHYVGGHSWEALLANYDMARGRLWPLILLWVLVAPYFFYRILNKKLDNE
ncbi:MAG: hypothetical protein EPO42_08130 [Gallionellaceae bacterium]|nr:MAG: hypothetical protein EPO42_08130 [Gallionellaceae bacterium]